MKKDLTLVILAAGMGSRFGGLKQIEPVGPNGEFIIDYSVYDAIRAGFSKIVFIIKKENYEIFKDTIGKRIEGKIPIEYVFQDINDIPEGDSVPVNRTKPWGTAHAVLCARKVVDSNFVMINSDDFYGYDAYKKIKEFFDYNNDENCYCMVAFRVENTITENGSVKRGVCEDENNYLTNIIESSIEKVDNKYIASPLDGREAFEVSGNALVSMNFFGFTKNIFTSLADGLEEFFQDKTNIESKEYLIPDVVFNEIKNNGKKVKILESTDKWLGVTYREDKEYVVNSLKEKIKEGEYPFNLWN